MSYKNIDELAAAMENILNDDTYRSVFERPRIKMASAESVKSDKNDVETAYEQLVEASNLLDKLGFSKSAAFTLLAVEKLLEEHGIEPVSLDLEELGSEVVEDKIDQIKMLLDAGKYREADKLMDGLSTAWEEPNCKHESETTADGHGAYCRICGETLE